MWIYLPVGLGAGGLAALTVFGVRVFRATVRLDREMARSYQRLEPMLTELEHTTQLREEGRQVNDSPATDRHG